MAVNPNPEIRELVDRWCERRELAALASLLPAWLANNGLTDGWGELREAVRHTYATCKRLPQDELDTLKVIIATIDQGWLDR
jgi:hypothetical protein